MKRPRYLIAVPNNAEAHKRLSNRLPEIGSQLAEPQYVEKNGLLLAVEGSSFRHIDETTVLIGSAFPRDPGSCGIDRSQRPPTADPLRCFIDGFWGGYVALSSAPDRGTVRAVRAPMGDLACYWVRTADALLIASDLSLLLAAGVPRPRVDAAALAQHLIAGDLRSSQTCLSGIRELQGGECLTISPGQIEQESLWSAWTFANRERQVTDPKAAAELVREAAVRSVQTVANQCRGILLKLSGGVDSSIVAACLAGAGRPFTAVNLVTREAKGDERGHARRVADYLGVPLLERFRQTASVSLDRSAAAALPRPSVRSFTQESSRILNEAAAATASDAVFDGGGGDNVFCSLQSSRATADCLIDRRGLPHLLRTIVNTAELAQVSVWTVGKYALAQCLRSSPCYPWHSDTRFLSAEAAAEWPPSHPWLDAPSDALPGKAAHIALIAGAQSVAEGFDPQERLPTYSPLLSQPMVEACLAVPSWLWFGRGRNREVARRAFVGRLPDATLDRRSKGAPDAFIAELFHANRGLIMDMLLGGVLMDLRLLDSDATRQSLLDDAPVRGHDFFRLMSLVDAEAWARCWV